MHDHTVSLTRYVLSSRRVSLTHLITRCARLRRRCVTQERRRSREHRLGLSETMHAYVAVITATNRTCKTDATCSHVAYLVGDQHNPASSSSNSRCCPPFQCSTTVLPHTASCRLGTQRLGCDSNWRSSLLKGFRVSVCSAISRFNTTLHSRSWDDVPELGCEVGLKFAVGYDAHG